jgi:hypothetical protein
VCNAGSYELPVLEGAMAARSGRNRLMGCAVGVLAASLGAAAPMPAPTANPSPAPHRALLDRYCVSCHNDRVKTANLSLQGLDLTKVGERADLWEKVIRKLRAGVMPPPDLPRPALAEYEGLRDFLEGEVDRAAAAKTSPGSIVLHRLNRTEYANAIRSADRPGRAASA